MATYVTRLELRRVSSLVKNCMQATGRKRENDAEELALLHKVAEQDREALAELYRVYHPRLFKFVFRLTSSYPVAEELVNDVMHMVWRKASSFRGDSRVSTWIFGIAYRQTMRRVTRNKVRLVPTIDVESHGVDADDRVETENWVRKGLDELPAAQQITVMLVFYLGLSYEETAAVTRCPVNTVKTRMFHARRKLKDALTAAALPPGNSEESDD